MNIKFYLRILAMMIVVLTVSCKKDKDPTDTPPPVTNDGELITTVKLTFTDSAGISPVGSAVFNDPDGEGGNPPVTTDTIKLEANKTYYTKIYLLDVSGSPVDTISNEVRDEANDHMFFYSSSTGSLNIFYNDQDTNNPPLPLGIDTKWKTINISDGSVRVILKHQPGIKDGTIVPGDTDVDVTFPLKIM